LLHRDPARAWTVEGLAREVAMSRSRFAARFTALVGRPPLDYLAEWRMQRARGFLRAGGASVGQVAGRLGYRSEAAFSHAFRRRIGVPPGAYRRAHAAAGPA
jgi:AraC-like DNA-binding protein